MVFATVASTSAVSRLHKLIPVYSFYSYWRIKDRRIFYQSLANTMIKPKKIFGNFRKLSLASREDSRETRAISVKKFPNIFLARKSSIQERLIKNPSPPLDNPEQMCYNKSTMITKENKDKAIASVARNKNDVGSPEVQVAILTARIKEVTEHVKDNRHDFMAKRGLIQMVGKRKKLLKYLEETDFELYKKTVAKLGLRK